LISVQELRRGWPTLVGAMIGMGAGLGTYVSSSSYFIKPLQAEFGWSRGQVALTTSTGLLINSLALPLMGVLIDRYGPRAFILVGSVLFSLAYLALSAMPGQFVIYVGIVIAISLTAAPATSPLLFTKPLVSAFDKSRGVALGFALSGAVIISFIVQPVLRYVISEFGWRAGYGIVLAPIALVCGLASFALLGGIRRVSARCAEVTPTEEAHLGHTLSEALRDARFWLFGVALVSLSLTAGAFTIHFQPLLSDMGIPGPQAALLGVWFAASIVIGRLIGGTLLDRFWAPGVGFVCLCAPVIGLPLFLGAPPLWLLVVGILLVGFSFGAEFDTLAFFTARYFGLRSFGAIIGVLGMAVGVSTAIGGALGGLLFDLRGDYNLNLVLGSGLAAVSAFSLLASGLLRGKVSADVLAAEVETAALPVSASGSSSISLNKLRRDSMVECRSDSFIGRVSSRSRK
jgi:MFS family permease